MNSRGRLKTETRWYHVAIAVVMFVTMVVWLWIVAAMPNS